MVYIPSVTQMQEKAMILLVSKLSPKEKMARSKAMVGDTYCKKPNRFNGSKRAP